MHQSVAIGALLFAGGAASCYEVTDREMTTAGVIEKSFARDPLYVSIEDNVLLGMAQEGDLLHFYKSSAGMGEGGAGIKFPLGGVGIDMPQGGTYAYIWPLEVAALINHDWGKLYQAAFKNFAANSNSVDPDIIRKYELMIETDYLPTDRYPLNHEYQVAYSDGFRHREEGKFVSVHIGLPGATILKISQEGDKLSFSKTSPGYGVTGFKVEAVGFGSESETPISDWYGELTPSEALGHVGGDWRNIYTAVVSQARRYPDSVMPSLVRETFCPDCPTPPGGVVVLHVEGRDRAGTFVSGPVDDLSKISFP